MTVTAPRRSAVARDPHVVEVARQVNRTTGAVALNWFLAKGDAVATQSLKRHHQLDGLRSVDVGLGPEQLAYVSSLAAMYHTQPGAEGFLDLDGHFTCAKEYVSAPRQHVLVRPFCQSPPYRIAPRPGAAGVGKYKNAAAPDLQWAT